MVIAFNHQKDQRDVTTCCSPKSFIVLRWSQVFSAWDHCSLTFHEWLSLSKAVNSVPTASLQGHTGLRIIATMCGNAFVLWGWLQSCSGFLAQSLLYYFINIMNKDTFIEFSRSTVLRPKSFLFKVAPIILFQILSTPLLPFISLCIKCWERAEIQIC